MIDNDVITLLAIGLVVIGGLLIVAGASWLFSIRRNQ